MGGDMMAGDSFLRKDKTARNDNTLAVCVSLQMPFPQVSRKMKERNERPEHQAQLQRQT